MKADVNAVLADAVKIVNFVKARPLNSRLFSNLCKEMNSDHDTLLLHTEVRWLSRGNVLQRLFELKDELRLFLLDAKSPLASCFSNARWLVILAYMADIFEKLNILNTSLQGPNTHILLLNDKICAFIKKLELWKSLCENDNTEMFGSMSGFIQENELSFDDVKPIILTHLDNLGKQFTHYFPDGPLPQHDWIRNPFDFKGSISHLPTGVQEQFQDLTSDRSLQIKFNNMPLTDFWLSLESEYGELSRIAGMILIPFASTYLCETAFSAMTAIKTKGRNRLSVEGDRRVALSKIQPRIDLLCSRMQAHPSH